MKIFIAILSLVSAFSMATFASPSAEQINHSALDILISNSGKLASEELQKVSSILARALTTNEKTHNKISNGCVYDKPDNAFKCRLIILNRDDKENARTESIVEIRYELERGSNGLPSDDLFYLTVQVIYGG